MNRRSATSTTPAGESARIAAALSARDGSEMDAMAADWRTAPEILFLLSQVPYPATRAKVAANPSTPDKANELLLNDEVAEVRAELGRKLAELLPELAGPEAARLRDAAVTKLLILARDADTLVRRRLSGAIAHIDCAPADVVRALARDVDELVAAPVLEFSACLDEDDLVALIAERPTALSLSAIARRIGLAPSVVDRLIESSDTTALTTLLRNDRTQIREPALDRLVDLSVSVLELQAPLVVRGELTERLVAKLGSFVAAAHVAELARRHDLSPQVVAALERRLEQTPTALNTVPTESDLLAACERHDEDWVMAALAQRASVDQDVVRRVFATRMAKAIVALAWTAGLTMSSAVCLQAFPGRIALARRLQARRDGSYPIGEAEIEWHLSSLGVGRRTEDAPQ